MAASSDSAIQNFQESPVKAIASGLGRRFAAGVHCLQLNGAVGEGESISFRSVRDRLARQEFSHLHVQISTTGGIVSEGMAIYEHLRALPVPVSSEVIGQCLSIGMAVLMAGDFRFSIGEPVLLNHPTRKDRATLPEIVTAATLRSYADQLESTDARIANLFAARTGHPVEFFLADAKTEDNLSSASAIQSGLLHEINGLPQHIDSSWPNLLMAPRPQDMHFPNYLRSQNYVNACKCAASLYEAAP